MACGGCSKKKAPLIQTFRVYVDVHKDITLPEIKDITIKLKNYAKKLINEA